MISPRQCARDLAHEFHDAHGNADPVLDAPALNVRLRKRRPWHDRTAMMLEAGAVLARGRIDVDDLAENFLDLRLRIEDLSPFDSITGAPVYGYAMPSERVVSVCRRALEYEPLYRATLAHEVGHVIMHGTAESGVHAFSPGARCRPPEERQADRFMAELLLPWALVELSLALTALVRNIRLDDDLRDPGSRMGLWRWHEHYLPDLTNRLGVSKHMALITLLERGVITQSEVDHHLRHGSRNRYRPSTCARTWKAVGEDLSRLVGRLDRDGSPQ